MLLFKKVSTVYSPRDRCQIDVFSWNWVEAYFILDYIKSTLLSVLHLVIDNIFFVVLNNNKKNVFLENLPNMLPSVKYNSGELPQYSFYYFRRELTKVVFIKRLNFIFKRFQLS